MSRTHISALSPMQKLARNPAVIAMTLALALAGCANKKNMPNSAGELGLGGAGSATPGVNTTWHLAPAVRQQPATSWPLRVFRQAASRRSPTARNARSRFATTFPAGRRTVARSRFSAAQACNRLTFL